MNPHRLKKQRFSGAVLPLLMVIFTLLLSTPSFASWNFNYTVSITCCSGGYCATSGSGPFLIGPFPNQSMCLAARSQVLATANITEPGCTNNTICTPCTGTDDSIGSSSSGAPSNPFAEAAGQPYFSPHYTANNENWITETHDRFNSFSWFVTGVPAFPNGLAASSDPAMNSAYAYLANRQYGRATDFPASTPKTAATKPQPEPSKPASDWQESEYFFQLQTRQTGKGGSSSPAVDTTSLVVPSKTDWDKADSVASNSTDAGGSALSDTLSGVSNSAQNAVDEWSNSKEGQTVSTLGELVAVQDGLVTALDNDTVGVASDLYGIGKDLKDGETGKAMFNSGVMVAAMAYPQVAAMKAYGDFCLRLEKFDEKIISAAAKRLADPNDRGGE
jgi:hypothetical protein